MFLALKPSRQQIQNFISVQTDSNFSYAHVGASIEGKIPHGYNVDHNRTRLGAGNETWDRAVKALQAWRMFDMPWVQLCWPDAPIQVGTNVAVLINHFGFCSLNAARIVYTIQDDGEVMRYGFAYGTLAEHGESGEERFSVEWDRSDDSVWYDLLAFSRPNALLARIGYPLARILQRRFVDGSKLAMTRAVSISLIQETKQPMLVYDGECGFCSHSIQFILQHEKNRELLFVTRQSELGVRLRRQYGLEAMESMLWIEDGNVLTESSAALRIAAYVGGWCRIAAIGSLVPLKFRNWAYRLFARNRHRFARNSAQCLVLTPEQRKRFVS